MKRIAFDLDETLGVPLIEGGAIMGFQVRPSCLELLGRLRARFTLCLWLVSGRRYLDRCLSFGLSAWFAETYSWDELPSSWKTVYRVAQRFAQRGELGLLDRREDNGEAKLDEEYLATL